MTVQCFADLRDPAFAGCREASWPHAPTLRALGEQLCGAYGRRFREEFFSESGEELGERVIVMVNGRHITHLQGVTTPLTEQDVVALFPVVAGG